MTAPLRVFLIAGEASGDRLGAPLIRALRAEAGRPVEVMGVGGELMEAEGLRSLFPADDLAVMGIAEVLPRLRLILRRIRETTAALTDARPDLLITIDSPGFGLRVARKARAALPGTVMTHYVAPSVWAWKPGRAAEMARYVDHVLALLPFEPPYMTAAGMTCDFVGHPAARLPRPDAAACAAFRAGIGAGQAPLLCVLPGSRRGEVSRLAAPFGEVVARVARSAPGLRAVIPAAAGVADRVAEAAAEWPVPVTVLDPRGMDPAAAEARKFACFAACDAALAASGTVSLELAAMGTPQVIAYKVHPLTAMIVKRMLRVDTATLVNLLLDARPIPEFIQEGLVPDRVAEAVTRLLRDPDAAAAQRAAEDRALALLGREGEAPSTLAARSALAALARGRAGAGAGR
ncbi:MAG: lipid-A-disaccharide synthase [Pseudomonadota bacterium]|nr:lipid-A-disaccharide synthase [Pseudomonadota bacterium]